MSDFPYGGSPETTRQWLEENGFHNCFIGWKADGLLGAEKEYILSKFRDPDEGERLVSLLNYARRAFPSIQGIQILFSSLIIFTFCFFSSIAFSSSPRPYC